jgi:hypothetical protein
MTFQVKIHGMFYLAKAAVQFGKRAEQPRSCPGRKVVGICRRACSGVRTYAGGHRPMSFLRIASRYRCADYCIG